LKEEGIGPGKNYFWGPGGRVISEVRRGAVNARQGKGKKLMEMGRSFT